MRGIHLLSLCYLTTFTSAASHIAIDQSNLPLSSRKHRMQENDIQLPMNPGLAQPPASSPDDQDTGDNDGSLRLSDILPRTRSINIFASLTRDVSLVSRRLDSATENSTLLAPLNSAMQELPRKPWEDRPDDNSAVHASDNEDKAAQNIARFVEEHIVPVSPWKPGKENKAKTLGGQELWWEERNGKKVILPGELVVTNVLGKVGNGEVWAIKGVVNYAY